MAAPILPISAPVLPGPIRPAGEAAAGSGFQDIFASAVGQVESMGQEASASVQKFLSGEGEDIAHHGSGHATGGTGIRDVPAGAQ
jgi:hypothetical protein